MFWAEVVEVFGMVDVVGGGWGIWYGVLYEFAINYTPHHYRVNAIDQAIGYSHRHTGTRCNWTCCSEQVATWPVSHGSLSSFVRRDFIRSFPSLHHAGRLQLSTKAAPHEKDSGVEDWGVWWTTVHRKDPLFLAITNNCKPPQLQDLVNKQLQTQRVDVVKMEYHAQHKTGRRNIHACLPHCDGNANQPSMTGVLVLYVDAITGQVLTGDSGTFGGGLNFGNGPSGKLRRREEGHLTIPSGSLYFFPGYFVTHSVAPMKKSGIIRYESLHTDGMYTPSLRPESQFAQVVLRRFLELQTTALQRSTHGLIP
jgi:hypothetical protein